MAAIETPNGWYAIIFALIFYFIIGIKDLIFIERNSAYEMLVFLIVFAGIFSLFNHFDRWNIPGTLWAPLFFGSCLFFLFKGFFEYMRENKEVVPAIRGKLLAGILAFVFWQISLAVLFLPISPFFQSAIMFLAAFLGIELFSDYTAGGLDRKKILRAFSFFFASIVLIVGIASWSI